VGLTGGDVSITIGYSRFELRVDLGYYAGAARVNGPIPLGGGAYLLGGWASGLAWAVGGGVQYRVTDGIAIPAGADYVRTSYFELSLTLRGQSNIRSTASIVYSFVRRSPRGRLA
jgi:opacity protein-like surface antigen